MQKYLSLQGPLQLGSESHQGKSGLNLAAQAQADGHLQGMWLGGVQGLKVDWIGFF